MLMHTVGAFLRTYRWIFLLRPIAPELSARRVLGIGLVGYTAVVFAPLRMGEVARPWLISQDGDVSFLQATGSVAAERIIDGLCVALFLVAGLVLSSPLSPLPDHVGNLPLPVAAVPAAAFSALAVFVAACIAMALFYFWRERTRRVLLAVIGVVSPKIALWIANKIESLAEGFSFLPSRTHGVAFARHTLAYWVVTVTSFWLLLRGCGAQASVAEACVILGITGLGTLIPSGPGFFGTYQMSAYCGLAMYFAESVVVTSGAAFVFISFTAQLGLTAASCLVGWRLMATSPPVLRTQRI
jgi:uncharacterized membrane protein YbhN (UPF0104 family)